MEVACWLEVGLLHYAPDASSYDAWEIGITHLTGGVPADVNIIWYPVMYGRSYFA